MSEKIFIAGSPEGITAEDSKDLPKQESLKGKKFYADSDGTIHTDKRIETEEEREAKIRKAITDLKGLSRFEGGVERREEK